VQQQVHGAEARHAVYQLDTVQRAGPKRAKLVAVEVVMIDEVVVRGEQETPVPQAGSQNRFAGPRRDALDHCGDERARREVLARASLYVLGVLLQQPS